MPPVGAHPNVCHSPWDTAGLVDVPTLQQLSCYILVLNGCSIAEPVKMLCVELRYTQSCITTLIGVFKLDASKQDDTCHDCVSARAIHAPSCCFEILMALLMIYS